MKFIFLIKDISKLNKTLSFICVCLLFNNFVCSQNNFTTQLSQQFNDYQKNYLQEKLFVHTDKTFYLASETIWFKIYIVDAFLMQPINISKVAYIEIIDKDFKPVLQTKIAIDSATGNGSIFIPASIVSGNYMLRAYTQWMKNFSADFFYTQQINVINTLRENSFSNIESKNKIDFQIFPEGGNLVDGLQSTIGFKTTNQYGDGVDATGYIINQKNDTLANFKSLIFGMGHFTFTPNKNDTYKTIIKLTNDSIVTTNSFLKINETGLVMNLVDIDAKALKVFINTSGTQFNNQSIYVLIHSHNILKSIQSTQIINGSASFIINKNDLNDGISHITIFNQYKQPVCERLFFKQPQHKLNIDLQTSKEKYGTREKVNIKIASSNNIVQGESANLSMSIFLLDSLQSTKYTDIQSYLLLISDIKGNIQSAGYYLNQKNKNVNEAVDNLMLTQGWSRFDWQAILQNQKPYFENLPEYEGLIVNGKVVNKKNGLPLENVNCYLSATDKDFKFLNSTSSQEGKIKFNLGRYYGNNEMIFQTDHIIDNTSLIDIENPFSTKISNNNFVPYVFSSNYKNDLLNRHIATQVENTYNIIEKKKHNNFDKEDSTHFYGLPTHTFNLDAYTRFNTMEEVIREFISDVKLRKVDNNNILRVYDRQNNIFLNNKPLVLLDGMPVFDINKLVAFSPLKIKSIDVVSAKYYLGASSYDGIVSFKTYDENLAGFNLDANAVVVKFDGLQLQREFYCPKYETEQQKENRLPDFRTTIYWKPNVITDANGQTEAHFYTSDVTGNYAILVQGITKNGDMGKTIFFFNVAK